MENPYKTVEERIKAELPRIEFDCACNVCRATWPIAIAEFYGCSPNPCPECGSEDVEVE